MPCVSTKHNFPLLNLIIDIGNTRTKLGIFQANQLLEKVIWDSLDLPRLKKLLQAHPSIQRIAASTVTYIGEDIETYLQKHFFYINLHHETPLPIQNLYLTPKTLGKDRLAAVIGAQSLFPNDNCLVIDAGTCVTYDILLKNKNYLGGNIAPGIEMRLKAMATFTARLPKIAQAPIDDLVGNNTETAIRTGGQLGAVHEMKAFIEAYQEKFGEIKVILTGGDAEYFANKLKTQIFVHQNLVLIGLNKILEHNVHISE